MFENLEAARRVIGARVRREVIAETLIAHPCDRAGAAEIRIEPGVESIQQASLKAHCRRAPFGMRSAAIRNSSRTEA